MNRKRLCIAAAILCSACLAGGVQAQELVQEGLRCEREAADKEENPMDLCRRLAVAMAGGSFDEVEERFSDEVKAQLPQETLQAVWEQTVADLGEYAEVYEVQEPESDAGTMVRVILRYEQGGLNVSFVLEDQEITGLWLNYYNIPEEPQTGEDYQEQEIAIGTYELDGRLTLPLDVENPPVVILVQGSGQSDMNETIGSAGNALFRDLAQGLAARGIATIRYNKRYYQYPEAAPADLTVEDEVLEDVAAAIGYAQECGLVDENRIIVLGHSLGGMLAPKIASDNPQVAAIISMAGSPRSLEDIMMDQTAEALEASGLSEEEQEEQMAQAQAEAKRAKEAAEDGTELILGAPESYWYSLNQIDAAGLAQELSIPMLFLQGDADFQVYPDVDFAMWQELLEGKEQVSFQLYEGLNHLFMPTSGKRDVTEYDTEAHADEQVMDDVADWIGAL